MSALDSQVGNYIHGLALQTQPTPVTCVQTCLAMALDVPVADVLDTSPSPRDGLLSRMPASAWKKKHK